MKKKFQKFLQQVFDNLKVTEKASKGELTAEDWKKVAENFKETHGEDMYEMIAKVQEEDQQAQSNAERAAAHDAAMQLISNATPPASAGADSNAGEGADGAASGADASQNNDLNSAVQGLVGRIANLEQENSTMRDAFGQLPNDVQEQHSVNVMTLGNPPAHNDTHLFGSSHSIFNLSSRWNRLFTNPASIHGMGEADQGVQSQFATEFTGLGSQIALAMNTLHGVGQLNPEVLRSSSNPDLTALSNAGLGDQFMQFRVRELVARVLELEDPFNLFPLRSGVQDREMITNAFIGELTQAWQDSEASLKGSSALEPEMGYVDDAMILSKFGSYKEMERKYIAYLNTNGSDPVKWTMIEYFMLLYMKQARKEQFMRVIQGVYCKPVSGTAGHYLNASTGVLNRVKFYHIEKKLRALVDSSMNTYDGTGTVFLDMLIEFATWLKTNLEPLGVDVENELAIYANKNHRQWFRSGYRSLYNLHGDFDGIEDTLIPDTQIRLIWVPNMGNKKMVWATQPGNLQVLENVPGEMFNFYMERRLNNVYVQSTWKEGTSAGYAGRKAADKATLDARAWDQQAIWFPKPYTDLAADDTTCNAANGDWFRTVQNTGATAITDITNKAAGNLYIIECSNTTNASTVAKTGNFSEITATYTPTAVGDLLAVVWDAGASKFKEVCRVVNGVLSYNSATTPNAIGAR